MGLVAEAARAVDDVAAGLVPRSGPAQLGDRMAAQTVFDGQPFGGRKMAVMDVAGRAVAGGRDGKVIEEPGPVAVLAEQAFRDAECLLDGGCRHP